MKLPAIPNAHRYVGLFVYDFGTHVAVGYTAPEIRVLRASEQYGKGTALQIYRVDDRGMIELCGVRDDRLGANEATCFLRVLGEAARRDYDALCAAADETPLGCAAEAQLARLYDFQPAEVTALTYPATATAVVAAWLACCDFAGGDQVVAGIDVHAALMRSDGVRIASRRLPSALPYTDRPAEEVLRTVREPLQR